MHRETIEITKALKGLAVALEIEISKVANKPIGFALIVFTKDHPCYVSNYAVNEVVPKIKHFLSTLKGEPGV